LAECGIAAGTGCRIDVQPLRERGCSPEDALFGEAPGGFLLSGNRKELESLGAIAIGEVGGTTIEVAAGDRSFTVGLDAVESAWHSLGDRLASES
jgi:phosphoribosylformylglycinamidine synthase